MSMTIEEVNGLAPKSSIPRIEGTLQAVYEPHRGTNSKGKYCIQNVVLAQGDETIRVGIFNGPNVDKSMEGEEVAIMCSQTPKGLTGVSATDNEYPKNSGTFNREIRMDRTARIMTLNDAPKDGKAPSVASTMKAKSQTVVSSAPQDSAHDITKKMVNVYHLARVELAALHDGKIDIYELTPDHQNSTAHIIAIQVAKQLTALKAVPTTPLYIFESKPTPSDAVTSEQPEQEA